MAQYTPVVIDGYIDKANTTLYKLRQKAEEDIFMRNDSVLKKQILIIAILKKAVEFEKANNFANLETHGLAAYLNHKISGYGFNSTSAYFATPTTSGSSATTGKARSGYQLFKQMVVGQVDAPASQGTTYTNSNLIGRYVVVILDGIILSTGLSDRMSYTYNINTGAIVWSTPLTTDQVIQIFTYIPTLSGWTKVDEFIVSGGGITTYTIAALVGKSVAVVVDGLILPIDLAGMLSYSYSALTGIVAFNSTIADLQSVIIYTY